MSTSFIAQLSDTFYLDDKIYRELTGAFMNRVLDYCSRVRLANTWIYKPVDVVCDYWSSKWNVRTLLSDSSALSRTVLLWTNRRRHKVTDRGLFGKPLWVASLAWA